MAMTRAARLEVLVWVLIYGGLLTAITGVFVTRQDPPGVHWIGGLLMGAGLVAALAGAVLIYVRSRMEDRS